MEKRFSKKTQQGKDYVVKDRECYGDIKERNIPRSF